MSNTIPANNNTGLYNATGNAVPISGNITTNNISATGNVIVDGFITAEGSITTNANFVGNLVGNVTGNITVSGANNTVLFVESGYTQTSNAFTFNPASNAIIVQGNVSGDYFIGNGSLLTGIAASSTYGNANVAAFLPTYNGEVNANTVFGQGLATQGYDYVQMQYSNATALPVSPYDIGTGSWFYLDAGGGVYQSNTTGTLKTITLGNDATINAGGNITAPYFIGNGSQLTGVVTSSYGNANVADFLPTYTGNLTANTISTTGNIVSAANLVTSGASGNIVGPNYVSANYFVGDGSLLTNLPAGVLAGNLTGNLQGNGFGANAFSFVSATGNVTGNYILGNGSALTSITGANVTGTVANATYATSSGTATSATTAGTVTANAQANITSVGTLTSLAVTGNITTGNILTNNYLYANGTPINFAGTYGNSNVASFMAAFGSNTVSTTGTITSGNITGSNILTGGVVSATGNVSGNFFIGNGSQLTGIAASYGNANVATFLAAFGSNTVSTTGNVNAGNVIATNIGNVAALNLNGNASQVLYGNGVFAPVAGSSTYGDSNVNTLLAAWGSNTLSTTGNVSVGNLNMTGQVFDSSGVLQLNAVGNIVLAPTSSTLAYGNFIGNSNVSGANLLTTGIISATGNATVGNIIATNIGNVAALNLNANASQVLYGNGVFAAVAGGGSPGGANTQIQFNDGGAFAGNTNMTFDKTGGNITLGNVVYNALNVIPGNTWPNVANMTVTSNVVTNPTRMVLGTGYFGNLSTQYNFVNQTANSGGGVGARLLVSDAVNLTGANARLSGLTVQNWGVLTANVASTSSQTYQGIASINWIGGGPSGNTYGITNPASYAAISGTVLVGAGTANTLVSTLGNTTVGAVLAVNGTVTLNINSSATTAIMFRAGPTYAAANISGSLQYGNITNLAGYLTQMTGTPVDANVVQTANVAHFYVPGTTAGFIPGASTANIPRMATSYFAFRNDDDLAQVKLGRLSSFNELRYLATSSGGALTVDKNNGQVQELATTEAVTSITFSNFVSQIIRPNSSYVQTADTVTLIVRQGSTGYAVTMPSGTAYKYAGGTNTLGTTANAVTMISVTGVYNSTAAATEYLITISPEFV